ncbi:MAG TPA: cupin domain-containing protein [Burkholderiales bacterium]|nr:cupin domain-containing protein [Burkholderiales bacterium]
MHIAPGTLGQVLYARPSPSLAPESEWVELVRNIADGDGEALLSLYDRTSDAVFTLFVRLTLDRELAEELAFQVYSHLRRDAAQYSRTDSTVLAWLMRQARSRALRALRAEQEKPLEDSPSGGGLIAIDMPDYRHILRYREETTRLSTALAQLAAEERSAIEAVYFDKSPVDRVKGELRRGLVKLARLLNGALVQEARLDCPQGDLVYAHALHALASAEAASVEAHGSSCRWCRRELDALRPVVSLFFAWPRDLLRPPRSLRERLMTRLGAAGAGPDWIAPAWDNVAPGIWCKLLSSDADWHLVSMLVRLAPGGEYPPHRHAGVEELHLLDGELWIEERKLFPGDYNRGEPGTTDKRVWSETGCTCVLVTSARDVLMSAP